MGLSFFFKSTLTSFFFSSYYFFAMLLVVTPCLAIGCFDLVPTPVAIISSMKVKRNANTIKDSELLVKLIEFLAVLEDVLL